jgi:hypothetical protein
MKTFSTQETWVQHLEFDHEYGPDWQSRPCPLCKEGTGDGAAACSKHLATHLEEISLATLPRPTDEDDVSQLSISSASGASGIGLSPVNQSPVLGTAAPASDEGSWEVFSTVEFDDASDGSIEVRTPGYSEWSVQVQDEEASPEPQTIVCPVPGCNQTDERHKLR